MLELAVSNGVAYVWRAEDWQKLRTEHRIIGSLDGGLDLSEPGSVRLPLRLSKVETQFLIKNGIGKTVEYPRLPIHSEPIVSEDKFQSLRMERFEAQMADFRRKRRSNLESMVDKIIEGKRKKGKSIVPDRNAVIQDEMEKIISLPYGQMIEIDLMDPWSSAEDSTPVDFPMPRTPLEILRLRVFEDFHLRRKYVLTPAVKFGGDFLAYPGDPTNHHSEFIIICQTEDRKLSEIFLSCEKRLADSVKKTLLIATLDPTTDSLNYRQI